MVNFPARVQQTIDHGYEFNFGEYISKGISLVTKNAGLFIAASFVFFLIMFVLGLIPFIGQLATTFILGPCLGAGFLIAARKSDEDQALEFGDFFKGFDYIGELVVMTIISTLIILALAIPFIAVAGFEMYTTLEAGGIPDFPIWSILLIVPLIYLAVAWSMGTYLVVFHGMKAWPALEASRQIVTKKWGFFFLLFIVVGIIACLGIIVFLIGMLFTYSIIPCANYAAFRDIVGVADEDSVDLDITSHLVD